MELIDILTVIIGRHHPYYIYVVKFTGKKTCFFLIILDPSSVCPVLNTRNVIVGEGGEV
jgi:hypothetical protein